MRPNCKRPNLNQKVKTNLGYTIQRYSHLSDKCFVVTSWAWLVFYVRCFLTLKSEVVLDCAKILLESAICQVFSKIKAMTFLQVADRSSHFSLSWTLKSMPLILKLVKFFKKSKLEMSVSKPLLSSAEGEFWTHAGFHCVLFFLRILWPWFNVRWKAWCCRSPHMLGT